jgi:hypothetical protein
MITKSMFGLSITAILTVALIATNFSMVSADPANKTTFGSSQVGVLAANTDWYTITATTIKTSSPSDLIVRHNQECTIHTGLNLDQDIEKATSAVREDIRLKVTRADGTTEYVSAVPGTGDDGIITMCGRAYEIDTNVLSTVYDLCAFVESLDLDLDGEPDNADVCEGDEVYFDSFIRTKAAHGWDWIVLDLGSGTHLVEVQAKLVSELDAIGDGKGKKGKATNGCDSLVEVCPVDTILEIGKRNLIITEEKLATGT